MFRKILPVLCAPLAFLVPLITFGAPVPVPTVPSQCLAQAPAGTQTGARRVSYCWYFAGSTNGQWEVFTIGSWTITVTHGGIPKIVARGSLSSPNMFGSYKTAVGDKVEVAINAICPTGGPQCASVGTVLASDQLAPAAPPAFPTIPGLPVGAPSSAPSASPSPTTQPAPSTANCYTTPAAQTNGAGQYLGTCEYKAKSLVGGWVAASLDTWTITVLHAGKWSTVGHGSMLAPSPQGSFVTVPGDVVHVNTYSVCLVSGVCGSFGSVSAGDRPAATPSDPQVPGVSNTPKAPSPTPTPSTGPAPTAPSFCLAQAPFAKITGAGRSVAECDYTSSGSSVEWQVFTIGSWTIAVTHAGVTTTVASGDLNNPNAFGSFATKNGDHVTVRIYSICTPGNVFCGSLGTVLASDKPGQLPTTPSFPKMPSAPAVPVAVPSGVPNAVPSTVVPSAPSQCVTSPMEAYIVGSGRAVAHCFYIASKTAGMFVAPTIGDWRVTAERGGKTVILASGTATGATPEGTYVTKLREQVTVTIDSICTPTGTFCGSIGFVRASDQ